MPLGLGEMEYILDPWHSKLPFLFLTTCEQPEAP